MKVDVIGSNSLLFANLPPASQVPGRTYRVSNVGPAPGILLTSDGTKYRPAGGRQVISNSLGAVTIQNITVSTPIITLATLPGGLLQTGVQVRCEYKVDHSGIGSGTRRVTFGAKNTSGSFQAIHNNTLATSGANLVAFFAGTLDIVSNTSGNHVGMWSSGGSSYGVGLPGILCPLDMSLPLEFQMVGNSVDETATSITGATWSGGVVTFTNPSHTLAVGDKTTVAGITPSGYNAVYIVTSVPNANTWAAALASNPGAYTSGGTSSRISNLKLLSYVLELVG